MKITSKKEKKYKKHSIIEKKRLYKKHILGKVDKKNYSKSYIEIIKKHTFIK